MKRLPVIILFIFSFVFSVSAQEIIENPGKPLSRDAGDW